MPATQYTSRREARAAEAARAAAQVGSELAVVPATSHELVVMSPAVVAEKPLASEAAASVAAESVTVPIEARAVVATAPRSTAPRATAPRASAPRATSRPAARPAASTAPSKQRKNPLSVLATMAVVGGLFAVAGLPAYAVSTTTEPAAQASAPTVEESQSIAVTADIASVSPIRDAFSATTPEDLAQANADAQRAAENAAYLASGARELGDDYPWPFELTDNQGGGLSPLNYYYRECVDFVAWRLNRDAGSYSAPFKYVWSNLTPYGGNGGQWLSNWNALGRTVSNVPIAGAVAYTGGNHVAYVNSVNADGSVNLEEYNFVPGVYSQRTIPASSVVAFLYPPG